jgi:tetratricopeptide (TPR) repeat protein
MTDINLNNLAPQTFLFWLPPVKRQVLVGPEQTPLALPQVPLPIKIKDMDEEDAPTDNAIGEGAYDYLREFPECLHNHEYAELLRDGYSHFLADMAAQVVMLDKKDVDPAYVFRKLTYLKILRLLEPENTGLLWQLCQGFYGLALTFTELPKVRRHLLDAMRYGQYLIKLKPEDAAALNLLAEIDILFGDYPTAMTKFNKVLESVSDDALAEKIKNRLANCVAVGMPDHPLVDDLERVGEAMQLYAANNFVVATDILERLEVDEYFSAELKSPDFLCLLGMCRIKTGDKAGAFDVLSQALEIDPEHAQARESIESI